MYNMYNEKEKEKLTVGLHDELWIKGARALPGIEKSLDVANAIACAKELHKIGELDDKGYKEVLTTLLAKSGYKFT